MGIILGSREQTTDNREQLPGSKVDQTAKVNKHLPPFATPPFLAQHPALLSIFSVHGNLECLCLGVFVAK